jgi:hypothetical protein
MNRSKINIFATLVFATAAGWIVLPPAHSAGATDFSTFKLVTERNIFDPNRYPHTAGYRPPRTVSRSAPAFALVGTLNYPKGMFAFFDGNSPEYRQVLQRNGVIAGYTVTDITLAGVTLKPAGTNAVSLDFKIGSQMRLNGTDWELTGTDEDFTSPTSAAASSPTAAAEDNNPPTTPGPAPSSGAVSDVLKRLMQQRAQEMK